MPSVQRDITAAFTHDVGLRTSSLSTTLTRGGAFLLGMLGPVVVALRLLEPLETETSGWRVLAAVAAAFLPVGALTAWLCAVDRTREAGRVMLFGYAFPLLAFLLTVAVAVVTGADFAESPLGDDDGSSRPAAAGR